MHYAIAANGHIAANGRFTVGSCAPHLLSPLLSVGDLYAENYRILRARSRLLFAMMPPGLERLY